MEKQEELTMFNHPLKWFKHQVTGWPQQNYYLWWFALGCQIMTLVNGKIDTIAIVTFFGTMIGVLCILSINAAKSVNGILGIISASCLIYVGISAKNYLSCFEQVAYMLTLDFPVIFAVKSWNDETVNHIKTFTLGKWIIAITATIIVWVLSAVLIGKYTNDPRPWIDGLSFAVSLTAGIMCFFRYNNQYIWWLFSSIFQLILWGITYAQGGASLAMAVNSSIYLMNDILAFTTSPWFKAGRKKMGLNEIKK